MNHATTFTHLQKQYLEGFFTGIQVRPNQADAAFSESSAKRKSSNEPNSLYGFPIDDLSKEERIKLEEHGLDCYPKIVEASRRNELPSGDDIFRFKYYGLFNVSPAQNALMLRCRIAGGFLRSSQLEGLAMLADECAGGYADLTTRANVQLREIQPKDAIRVIDTLVDLGITSRGSGADNLRNITASPTAGFDPHEIYDVRDLAKQMHHRILNTRELYDLPRKFNISFDGGGVISVCSDTNDIAFYAVKVGPNQKVDPGVYFRVQLAGITGHRQFAKDSGILIKPENCVAVATAMIQVFAENGDRTNRKKARLKYLIDEWGMERFVKAVEDKLDFKITHFPEEHCQTRQPIRRHQHIGIHPQKEAGLNYIGVAFPVGRMLPDQMRRIAELARRYGRAEVRLTVWQNLLIPYIGSDAVDTIARELEAVGLSCRMDPIRSGLIACTGNKGCKFAACDTKGHALELGAFLSKETQFDQPVNVHLTGCPHSCAQHYVGDIGLQGVKVKVDGESVEGYNIVFGGGVDNEQGIAKEVFKNAPFAEVQTLLKNAFGRYSELRSFDESFLQFNRRHTAEELREIYSIPTCSPNNS